MNGERMEHYRKILEEVTKHASETERRADEAERETVKRAVFCTMEIGQNGSNSVTGWNNMQNAQVIRLRIVQNRKLNF